MLTKAQRENLGTALLRAFHAHDGGGFVDDFYHENGNMLDGTFRLDKVAAAFLANFGLDPAGRRALEEQT